MLLHLQLMQWFLEEGGGYIISEPNRSPLFYKHMRYILLIVLPFTFCTSFTWLQIHVFDTKIRASIEFKNSIKYNWCIPRHYFIFLHIQCQSSGLYIYHVVVDFSWLWFFILHLVHLKFRSVSRRKFCKEAVK